MKKILILNEELGTQMQIYLALCDAYSVEVAENVESVMYYLRKMKPEILVLDYKLDQFLSNGKTADDFVRKVKKKYKDLKIVLVKDNADEDAEKHGADEIVYTPIKNQHLLSNMRKLTAPVAVA